MNTSRARLSSVETLSQSDADQAGRPTGERLFDIAAALFCEKGYAATTTREIAAAAGIQQASLYYHVTGKEDLLHQICVYSLEQLFAEVQAAVNAAGNPLERIEVLAGTHLRTILRHQIRYVTMLNELRALSSPHRTTVMALRKKYANLVRSVIEKRAGRGRYASYRYSGQVSLSRAAQYSELGRALVSPGPDAFGRTARAYFHLDLSHRRGSRG